MFQHAASELQLLHVLQGAARHTCGRRAERLTRPVAKAELERLRRSAEALAKLSRRLKGRLGDAAWQAAVAAGGEYVRANEARG